MSDDGAPMSGDIYMDATKKAMTKSGIEDMIWPTLRHKFGGPRFIRWPCNAGFYVITKNWYFGNYLMISLGWFAFACGGGVYPEDWPEQFQGKEIG